MGYLMCIGNRNASITAKAKYSSVGDPKAMRFLGEAIEEANKELLEASLAASTWSKHNSAMNSIEKFEHCSGKKFQFPYTTENLCEYVSWALVKLKLKPSTVKSYLASIKTIHKLKNLDCDTSNYLIKALITGAENLALYGDIARNARKVMTLQLLKILGHAIAMTEWTENSKIVIWTACVTAFFGSFRFGELLATEEFNYNPAEIMMWSDVNFTTKKSVLLHVKIDKCKNVQGSYIDLFKFEGHSCCPIAALNRLKAEKTNDQNPVFMFKTGKLLTTKNLNECIRNLLMPIIGQQAMNITGHSFRAALPAALANDPKIANDSDIKKWGRWSSESYLLYTRLKFKQKQILFTKITAVLNKK